jgi:monofunctional biosynthetic peptidoglycan transglycosylase
MTVLSDPLVPFRLQQAAYRWLGTWKPLPRRRFSRTLSSRPPRGPRASVRWLATVALKLVIAAHILYFGSIALTLTLWKFSDPGATSLMAYRRVTLGIDIKPVRFIPFRDISAGTRNAFITLEDHEFWQHFGVSPEAIRDAIANNRRIGRTVYGGSTITQQAARSLFLSPDRNLVRKYLEAGTAIIMELILGKHRIMELYLNYIEFGPGVFGLGAAARHHYKASYYDLSYEQRVRLAVIITAPLRYDVHTFWKNRGMAARYNSLIGD